MPGAEVACGSRMQSGDTCSKRRCFGVEVTPDGVRASNGAYDRVGWTIAYAYVDLEATVSRRSSVRS
jgi:hypothetical protein